MVDAAIEPAVHICPKVVQVAALIATVCVTCVWAGVDSAWEQENAEARKMLENAAESHTSGARFVRPALDLPKTCFISVLANFRDSL